MGSSFSDYWPWDRQLNWIPFPITIYVGDVQDPRALRGAADRAEEIGADARTLETPMSAPVRDRFTGMIEAGATPIRRWGTAEDVGRTVASLATGALPYSIGQPINVDGGLLVFRL